MLMKPEKKDSVQLIMGKLMGKNKPEMEEQEVPESEDKGIDDNSIAVETAAEELIQAIEAKSAKGIVEAIKSLIAMLDD